MGRVRHCLAGIARLSDGSARTNITAFTAAIPVLLMLYLSTEPFQVKRCDIRDNAEPLDRP
jgi:hypothetical protein